MNLANKITLVRICVIPVTMVLFILGFFVDTTYTAIDGRSVSLALLVASCVIYALAACTDFVDGGIARHTNTVTSLGKFLDPIADKVLVVVMLVLVVGAQIMPEPYMSIMVGLIFAREFMVGALRQIAVAKGFVMAADIWGKIKTVVTDFAIGFLLIAPLHIVIWYIALVFLVAAFLLTMYSGFNYLWKNRAVFSEDVPEILGKEKSLDEVIHKEGAADGGESSDSGVSAE